MLPLSDLTCFIALAVLSFFDAFDFFAMVFPLSSRSLCNSDTKNCPQSRHWKKGTYAEV